VDLNGTPQADMQIVMQDDGATHVVTVVMGNQQ
jgi:hypothetical protein